MSLVRCSAPNPRPRVISRVLVQCAVLLAVALFDCGLTAQTVTLDNVAPIALTGSSTVSAVSIEPSTGNVIVRSAIGNFNQCTGITAVPTITAFTASPSSVAPGGNITLSWTSSNATSCTPSQGGGTQWPNLGTLSTSGSQPLTAPQTLGPIFLQLTCTNGSTNDMRTVQVTVEPQTSNCPPIFASGTVQEFNESIGIWPAHNDKIRQFVGNNQYFSLRFTATANPLDRGTINTTGFPGDGDGNGVVSISTGPGCFNASILSSRCVSNPVPWPGVSWTNGQSAFVCTLTPGRSYHVNMYFPDCPGGLCGRDFGNIQQLLNMQDSPR